MKRILVILFGVSMILFLSAASTQGFNGNAPFDGLNARGWNTSYGRASDGYCPWASGYGWDGYLAAPTNVKSALEIPKSRQFSNAHRAIDINVPIGTPVYAAEDGIVVWNGTSRYGGGIMVKLSHGSNWFTSYVHLSGAVVRCGQYVSPGQLIGYSGQTGTSWPHLHFSVNKGNASHDPCSWLSCTLLPQTHRELNGSGNTSSNVSGGSR